MTTQTGKQPMKGEFLKQTYTLFDDNSTGMAGRAVAELDRCQTRDKNLAMELR